MFYAAYKTWNSRVVINCAEISRRAQSARTRTTAVSVFTGDNAKTVHDYENTHGLPLTDGKSFVSSKRLRAPRIVSELSGKEKKKKKRNRKGKGIEIVCAEVFFRFHDYSPHSLDTVANVLSTVRWKRRPLGTRRTELPRKIKLFHPVKMLNYTYIYICTILSFKRARVKNVKYPSCRHVCVCV